MFLSLWLQERLYTYTNPFFGLVTKRSVNNMNMILYVFNGTTVSQRNKVILKLLKVKDTETQNLDNVLREKISTVRHTICTVR